MTTPEKLYVVGGDGWVLDDGGNGRLIANCGGYTESLDPAKSNDENRANAKRIALRYNTFPDFVAALGEVIYAYDVVDPHDDGSSDDFYLRITDVMDQIRAAHASEVPA